jgi:hypothetical protein
MKCFVVGSVAAPFFCELRYASVTKQDEDIMVLRVRALPQGSLRCIRSFVVVLFFVVCLARSLILDPSRCIYVCFPKACNFPPLAVCPMDVPSQTCLQARPVPLGPMDVLSQTCLQARPVASLLSNGRFYRRRVYRHELRDTSVSQRAGRQSKACLVKVWCVRSLPLCHCSCTLIVACRSIEFWDLR